MENTILTIAITGHRDIPIEYEPQLQNKIVHIISEIKSQYPQKLVHFLSPLAEGADQIAAMAAIQTKCNLIVPIPMKEENYLPIFDQRSLERYQYLLQLASKSFVLSCKSCKSKEDYYLNLGKHIIQNSNILLVLWDGIYSDKIGGTGYIMKHLDDLQSASKNLKKIIHLRTPRKSNPFIEHSFQVNEINNFR